MFGAFLDLLGRFGLVLHPVVAGAFRSLATLQATLSRLAPDRDIIDEAVACVLGRDASVVAS